MINKLSTSFCNYNVHFIPILNRTNFKYSVTYGHGNVHTFTYIERAALLLLLLPTFFRESIAKIGRLEKGTVIALVKYHLSRPIHWRTRFTIDVALEGRKEGERKRERERNVREGWERSVQRKREIERDRQMKIEINRWKIVKGIQRCHI